MKNTNKNVVFQEHTEILFWVEKYEKELTKQYPNFSAEFDLFTFMGVENNDVKELYNNVIGYLKTKGWNTFKTRRMLPFAPDDAFRWAVFVANRLPKI